VKTSIHLRSEPALAPAFTLMLDGGRARRTFVGWNLKTACPKPTRAR
jgi:hypothetical protein